MQAPVASVERQKACSLASLAQASTMHPSVAPASSAYRHITLSSSLQPSAASIRDWRWKGIPQRYFCTSTCAIIEGASSPRGNIIFGIGTVMILNAGSSSQRSASGTGRLLYVARARGVEELHALLRHLFGPEVATSLRLGPRLGDGRRVRRGRGVRGRGESPGRCDAVLELGGERVELRLRR